MRSIVIAALMSLTPLSLSAAQALADDPVLACGGTVSDAGLEVRRGEELCPWPFDVEAMTIICVPAGDLGIVYFESAKGTFGLNGLAASRYDKIPTELRLDDPNGPADKVYLGPWIAAGVALCDRDR